MEIIKEIWSIQELIKSKVSIDPRPQYQRTSVWNIDRKAFLIDSILRGYDLPKFYFTYHKDKTPRGYTFEVADGQQRIKAIWDFFEDKYPLKKNTIIEGVDLSHVKYSQLTRKFKEAFENYDLNISNILSSLSGEVNDLFTRLQKGVSLNPPELRHAMISNIGIFIDKFVEVQQTSGFFQADSKIPDLRFKHQEYIDHVIALVHYKNEKDLKATTIAQLYIDFADNKKDTFAEYFDKATLVLKAMSKINAYKKGIFKNKWSFVDAFWLLYRNIDILSKIDSQKFAKLFVDFENERRKFNANPEELLSIENHRFGRLLFDYIQAFNKEGANKGNIQQRAKVFDKIFSPLLNF
jgi:hypothetical protein